MFHQQLDKNSLEIAKTENNNQSLEWMELDTKGQDWAGTYKNRQTWLRIVEKWQSDEWICM